MVRRTFLSGIRPRGWILSYLRDLSTGEVRRTRAQVEPNLQRGDAGQLADDGIVPARRGNRPRIEHEYSNGARIHSWGICPPTGLESNQIGGSANGDPSN